MTSFLRALGKIYKSGYLPTMSIRRLLCSLEWSFHMSSRQQLPPPPPLTLITLELHTHNTQQLLPLLPPLPPMTSTPMQPLQLLQDMSPLGAMATQSNSRSPQRHLGQLLQRRRQLLLLQHLASTSLSSCKQTECNRPAI
uniref:RNA binding motif protein 24 n=1 Tax=Saimiri boliviensis boliviensis TaxID=39432 RepID=A0A2K6U5K7_SAIBB